MDIGIEVQRDVNGIEMGVLENGIPFLSQTGLAKLAGVVRSVIFDISQDWEDRYDESELGKDRLGFIKEYLFRNGYTDRKLYIETKKDGSVYNAYPDIVCMAIIEYYAFEAKNKSQTAIDNYRRLATFGLQKFIYEALNYIPSDKWKYHHDRVSILKNSSPDGHFIIFNEVTGLIVDLITANLMVNHKTIPDISVGICWGEYWAKHGMDFKYGYRIKYEHNYPSYYPQSASNPQQPWAYPDEALPVFRKWFKQDYLPTRFPRYILGKANLLGGQLAAQQIAGLYQPKQIR
ncbi:hypothetical protein [Mesorhizobium sp. M0220]|uniref:hypothetical protein n=1 Tax=unclassified Mesorhizobium TaxID=325217 RepID=UPI003334F434